MGSLLSAPVVDKQSEEGGNTSLAYASSSMQGWRTGMEDAHLNLVELQTGCSLFGVYDGHGGREVSRFIKENFPNILVNSADFKSGDYAQALVKGYLQLDTELQTKEGKLQLYEYAEKKQKADFLDVLTKFIVDHNEGKVTGPPARVSTLDSNANNNNNDNNSNSDNSNNNSSSSSSTTTATTSSTPGESQTQSSEAKSEAAPVAVKKTEPPPDLDSLRHGFGSGSTAVTALLVGKELYVANCGDSRCVLSVEGKAVEMSHDHKPTQRTEYERITKAGGFVTNGRVMGDLNLSRAIGDLQYKQNTTLPAEEQAVTAFADIKKATLTGNEDFLIIGCDGIWDVKSNQEAVSFVRERLDKNVSLKEICEQLLDNCLAPDASGAGTDNMTVVIVRFLKPSN